METEDFDHLVGQIYDAALAPDLWQSVLAALKHSIGADGAHLLGWDGTRGGDILAVTVGDERLSSDAVHRYNAYYGAIDPRRQIAATSAEGEVIACHRNFNQRFVEKDEFFQDFLLPLGFRYSIGASVLRSAKTDYQIALQREIQRGPFEENNVALLSRLTPHLARSLRLMEQSHRLAQMEAQAAKGLDAISLAIFALDITGRVLDCNQQGDALLRLGEVISLRNGRLVPGNNRENATWFAEAVREVAQTGRPANRLLPCSANNGNRHSLTLLAANNLITPLSLTWMNVRVLCLIAPLDKRRIATARQLIELFRLTAAEAHLATALASGQTLEEYACESGLRLSTVKSQLRAVFSKMSCDSQASLIRLVTAIPAVRDGH